MQERKTTKCSSSVFTKRTKRMSSSVRGMYVLCWCEELNTCAYFFLILVFLYFLSSLFLLAAVASAVDGRAVQEGVRGRAQSYRSSPGWWLSDWWLAANTRNR